MQRPGEWHDRAFFGVHYDLCSDVIDLQIGAELTHEHVLERLHGVCPDWVQVDAKCSDGLANWPCSKGYAKPGLTKDLVRIYADACREAGIPLVLGYSGVVDRTACLRRRKYAAACADGYADAGGTTCRNSQYDKRLMLPQLQELLRGYDVAGIKIVSDSTEAVPCWCSRCVDAFRREMGIRRVPRHSGEINWEVWTRFHRRLYEEHVAAYARTIHDTEPPRSLCSDGLYTASRPDAIVHEVDFLSVPLPVGAGVDRIALEARVMDSRGMNWELGLSAFAGCPDNPKSVPVAKPARHLCQEISEIVALGGASLVRVHAPSSGLLPRWHHDILAEAGGFCQARRRVCFHSESASEAAVVYFSEQFYQTAEGAGGVEGALDPIRGALDLLVENQVSTDVIPEPELSLLLREYRLVVAPEQSALPAEALSALHNFVASGGVLILSGAHLAREVPEFVGVRGVLAEHAWEPRQSWGTIQVPFEGRAVGLGGQWQPVEVTTAMPLLQAMRGEEPGRHETRFPAATLRTVGEGCVVAFHGPLFDTYVHNHNPRLRGVFGRVLAGLNIDWGLEVVGAPCLAVVARRHRGCLCVNLINRGAGERLSAARTVNEDIRPIREVAMALQCGEKPARVTLEPEGTELEFEWYEKDSRIRLTVPEIDIHSVVVVEPSSPT